MPGSCDKAKSFLFKTSNWLWFHSVPGTLINIKYPFWLKKKKKKVDVTSACIEFKSIGDKYGQGSKLHISSQRSSTA